MPVNLPDGAVTAKHLYADVEITTAPFQGESHFSNCPEAERFRRKRR
jgi:hypothetical protein